MKTNPLGRALLTALAATGFFTLLTILCQEPTLSAGVRDFAPSLDPGPRDERTSAGVLARIDGTLVAAQVRRNAIGLLEGPLDIFRREMCYPEPLALTTGDPMITAGLLGLPGHLLFGGAAGAVNSAVGFSILFKALAMFLLVRLWTGSAAAGLVAGLLFSFDAEALGDVTHFYIYDTAWFVFALYFSCIFFRTGSWLAAASVVICTVFQVANCLYPAVAAAAVGLPTAAWLLFAYSPSLSKVLLLAVPSAAGVALIYAPYLSQYSSEPSAQVVMHFLVPQAVRPSALPFSVWILVALALAGVSSRPGRATPGVPRDARWALLLGGVLCTWLAIGPSLGPGLNLFSSAARWIPGLAMVRAPLRIFEGTKLVAAVLAGMGAAALLSRLPPVKRRVAAAALVGIVTVATVGAIATASPRLLVPLRVTPPVATLRLFEKLAAMGNKGPVFEIPVTQGWLLGASSSRVMASTFHRRPTSACSGSVKPESARLLVELGNRLPKRAAVTELRELGFTTIILHRSGGAHHFGTKVDAAAPRPTPPGVAHANVTSDSV